MRELLLITAIGVVACVPVLAQQTYKPGPENIALPGDYQSRFIRFATVDKADRKIVRFLYVNPEAFESARPGHPLPDGTVIIMEDHPARVGTDQKPLLDQQGRFIPQPKVSAVFVQEKREGWGIHYPADVRNGNWEYARFNPDGSRHPGAVQNCFACHLSTRAGQDFAFNFWDFVQTRK